jgi:uncharacterized protein (DUF1810 family)
MSMLWEDELDLGRFIEAQRPVFETALGEIKRGRKRSHWMWFIFPQTGGLGRSETARYFAIRSRAEAAAYADHPFLGERLRACVTALQNLPPTSAEDVFGAVDAIKLRSSLTLFEAVTGDPLFSAALDRWFAGSRDATTLELLAAEVGSSSNSG